jgi:hypothetical protein
VAAVVLAAADPEFITLVGGAAWPVR